MANVNQVSGNVLETVIEQVNGAIMEKYEQRRADEELFLMGMRLGRALAEQGLPDARLEFFSKQAQVAQCLEEAFELTAKMNKLAKVIVHGALKEQVKTHGMWSVGRGYPAPQNALADEIEQKYHLQISSIRQSYTDDDIDLEFDVGGTVGEIFARFGFEASITAVACCYEGKAVEYYSEEDIEHELSDVKFSFGWEPCEEHMGRLEGLANELEKLYLVEVLSG